MRDINRIPKILKRIESIWLKHPDLRLGQLILNPLCSDQLLYGIEDEELMRIMEILYEKPDKFRINDIQRK